MSGDVGGDPAATPLADGVCNMLYAMENVRTPGAAVAGAVAMTGNWVGGRYSLRPHELRFTMNALNARLQADTAPRVIATDEITDVREGRLFWVFKTVDVETRDGLARFRCAPGGHARLLDALRRLLDRRSGA